VGLSEATRVVDAAPWTKPYDGEADAIWTELWAWHEDRKSA
jgi:hypothetical protein